MHASAVIKSGEEIGRVRDVDKHFRGEMGLLKSLLAFARRAQLGRALRRDLCRLLCLSGRSWKTASVATIRKARLRDPR